MCYLKDIANGVEPEKKGTKRPFAEERWLFLFA